MGRRQRKKRPGRISESVISPSQAGVCQGCQSTVNETARFCETCGERIAVFEHSSELKTEELPLADAALHAIEFDSSEGQRLAREMLTAHLALITQTTKVARGLQRSTSKASDSLSKLTLQPPSPERTAELEELVEQLEGLGDDWEDLQRSHNDELEALDDDFLDRFSEIELDIELPPKLQEKFDARMNELLELLDQLEERVAELGSEAMRELSRAGGRFNSVMQSANRLPLIIVFSSGLGGSLAWSIVQGVNAVDASLSLAPVAVLGAVALSLAIKRR